MHHLLINNLKFISLHERPGSRNQEELQRRRRQQPAHKAMARISLEVFLHLVVIKME